LGVYFIRLSSALLLVTGEDDEVTPPVLSQKLYQAATVSSYKKIIIVPEAVHGDAALSEEFAEAYKVFASKL